MLGHLQEIIYKYFLMSFHTLCFLNILWKGDAGLSSYDMWDGQYRVHQVLLWSLGLWLVSALWH